LQPGEPAPWFRQRSGDSPSLAIDAMGGRYIVLCFFASSQDALAKRALKSVRAERALFDDQRFSFLGVTMDRRDDAEKLVKTRLPGIRYIFDFDGMASKLYGALPADLKPGEADVLMRRFWVVVSPGLRVLRVFAFEADGSEQSALFDYLKSLPAPELAEGFTRDAPVLMLSNIFEPELCQGLMALYDKSGQSGDYLVQDRALVAAIQIRMQRRVLPELLKCFQFRATRLENYILARFNKDIVPPQQRDNTSVVTAHRRFSVAINLNDDYRGGGLIFPEYGPREFRAPAGGTCLFSSSLLHAQTPITRGHRYAFTPFLYDEDGARVRGENGAVPANESRTAPNIARG
jgi:peroxiredoxin